MGLAALAPSLVRTRVRVRSSLAFENARSRNARSRNARSRTVFGMRLITTYARSGAFGCDGQDNTISVWFVVAKPRSVYDCRLAWYLWHPGADPNARFFRPEPKATGLWDLRSCCVRAVFGARSGTPAGLSAQGPSSLRSIGPACLSLTNHCVVLRWSCPTRIKVERASHCAPAK